MTSKKFKVIEGGRDVIERNIVIALFEGNIAEVEKLSAQLDAIAGIPSPKLELVKTSQNAKLTDTPSKTDG